MDIHDSCNSKEIYLYIDFDNKIRNDELERKNIFFRAANLNTECPLIQLNDHLFKGSYEDCVGTNLFFEEDEKSVVRDISAIEDTTKLTHKITQFKTLTLRSLRIPSNLKDLAEPEYDIKIDTSYDHITLLKKLCAGTVTLEDGLKIIPKSKSSSSGKILLNDDTPAVSDEQVVVDSVKISDQYDINNKISEGCFHNDIKLGNKSDRKSFSEVDETMEASSTRLNENIDSLDSKPQKHVVDILLFKYEKLKKLAKVPTRRKEVQEEITKCDPKYQKAYEYNSIKSQVIKPSNFFPIIKKKFNKETLLGVVDLDRSIIQGIIKPMPGYVNALTEVEKTELLSLKNLENLSMPARYWVLKTQLHHLESTMLTLSEDELAKEDEFGRTIRETATIYKRLSRVIHDLVQQNYSYNSDAESEEGDSSGDNSEEMRPSDQF